MLTRGYIVILTILISAVSKKLTCNDPASWVMHGLLQLQSTPFYGFDVGIKQCTYLLFFIGKPPALINQSQPSLQKNKIEIFGGSKLFRLPS